MASIPLAMAFLAAPADAGSVFMKNGYILQGKIVDRDADTVVLGWDNGKVMIHRRFVDEVVFEAGEEEALQRLEEARREQVDDSAEISLLEESEGEADELPATLELFVEKFDLAKPQNAQATSVVSLPVSDDPGTVTVTPIENPQTTDTPTVAESTLGDRQSHSSFGVSLRPPRGWSVESTPEAFVVRGQRGQGSVAPSLNVVAWPRDAKATNLAEVLAEEQKRTFTNFEVLHTGQADVGTETARVIAGRGTFEGSEAIVTQFLVERGERVWLFSVFSPVADNDENMDVVDQVLASVEFPAN